MVEAALDGVCGCRVDVDDPFVIDINYPVAFPDGYLRPEVRLEIAPLASWLPYEDPKRPGGKCGLGLRPFIECLRVVFPGRALPVVPRQQGSPENQRMV